VKEGIRKIFVGSKGLRAGWCVLLFALLIAGFALVLRHVFPRLYEVARVETPIPTLVRNGVGVLVVFLLTWVLARIERRGVDSYGLRGPRSARNFAAGLGWGLILFSLLIGVLVASGHLALGAPTLRGSILTSGLTWLVAFFLVAFLEETLFRGYLLFTLTRGIGFWPAAILLSLLFGLAHLRSESEVLLGIGTAIAGGLIFSLALRLSGSLWWGIGFHAAWDWAESFLYGTSDSGYIAKGPLLTGRPMGAPLLSGGSAGPEGSLFVVPVLIATFFVAWLTLKHPAPGRSTPAKRA
jgi:membrane protease YdiL (CAAX protease family)